MNKKSFKWVPDMTVAENLVRNYYHNVLEIDTDPSNFGVFIVWQCYILGNRKYLIGTTNEDNLYFEITYDAVKKSYYMDVYNKEFNIEFSENGIDILSKDF